MNKTAAIEAVIAATTDHPIIFTTGYSCRIARHTADRANHFYMTGSMGLASSIGIGVSLETHSTTIVVDGDGSLLMNPVGLVMAGALKDLPLIHIVLDDGKYASTGGQMVPSARADLCALATASGYAHVTATASLDEFLDLLRTEVVACSSPTLILVSITDPDYPVPGRIDSSLGDHAYRFSNHVVSQVHMKLG